MEQYMQNEWKKAPKETFRVLWLWLQKKKDPKNLGWQGTNFAGEFKKLCKAERKQIYSTMSETKAAFAERTIQSRKNILYRYMEKNGYQYNHKLSQFATTLNSRSNCSIDLIPQNVKNSDVLSILYSKPLREYQKPKFKIGDRIRISRYDLLFRKGLKPQFTQDVFELVAFSSRKPPT